MHIVISANICSSWPHEEEKYLNSYKLIQCIHKHLNCSVIESEFHNYLMKRRLVRCIFSDKVYNKNKVIGL